MLLPTKKRGYNSRILDHNGRPFSFGGRASSSSYEGAGTGRRLQYWGTSTQGPNTAISGALTTLRSRTRDLGRNNPLADGAVESFVSNLVGTGIKPRWVIDDQELKKKIQKLWNYSASEIDADGISDFYGLQGLICREMIEGGECFARLRYRRAGDGLAVPIQLQVIESDFLDETYTTYAPNQNKIRMGIEKDSIGRRVAYWMFKSHPGESFFVDDGSTERVRVPADEIIHTFRQERAGQDRGRPWLSSVIVKLHDIDECVDAELVRRKTTAMFGGFVRKPGAGFDENPETDGHILGTYDGTDAADASKVIDFQPGTFPYLPEGWDIVFAEPKDVTGNYIAWIEQQLRDVARGIGITFEQLTGNLKGTSYSSIRAGLVEFRRLAEMYQYQILIHMFCRPFIKAWMDQAVLSGALDISDYLTNWRAYNVVEWRPAGWAWVDPLKDIKGDVMAVRSGFKSRSQIINEYGYDPETIDAEMMEDNTRADEMGLILDSDPRKTTLSGMYQIDTTGGEDAE